jgi:LPXTG-motif cell wall-anchored protein
VITCNFTDTQGGRILVDKVTDPSGDSTLFEFDPSWGDNFLLADGDSPFDSGYLSPGTFGMAEVNLPAGWSLIGATCSDGSDPAAIDLSAGEVVTCTFSNLNPPEGSITIIKDATPLDASGDDTPFGFSGDLGAFTLMDPSDPSKTVIDLAPGLYVVTEGALPENWVLGSVVCDARSWSADGSSVTIDLAQGETVVCTFSNFEQETLAPTGVLTIIKDATPGDNTVFNCDAGALGTFSLKDPADPSKTFSQLEPGTYTVTEAALTGAWALREVECTAGDWSADGSSVTVNLAEGEVAECTFFNDGELPFTGPDAALVPALLAGLAALTLGLGLLLLSRRRETA